jgi:hypothetical protein
LNSSTIAFAYSYFDTLFEKTKNAKEKEIVNNHNIKIMAVVCLLLAFKFNEDSEKEKEKEKENDPIESSIVNIHNLFKNIKIIIKIKKQKIVRNEFKYFSMLDYKLDCEHSALEIMNNNVVEEMANY